MTSSVCTGRLRKEYKEIQKKPVENILTSPRETNILEWHYVIMGPKGSQYEGGFYHGIVTFPNSYPYKPPSIQMLTPNGRFKVCGKGNVWLIHTTRSSANCIRFFVDCACSSIGDRTRL